METNTLKFLAGNIVTKYKMSISAKLQLLNWLQNEASEVQIKALLLDGEPFVELDEQAEEIVNSRFEGSEKIQEIFVTGVDLIAAALATASVMAYKRFMSKSARACKGRSGSEKTACMNKFKQAAVQAQIRTLSSGAAKCAKSKDPAKCKTKVANQIAKLKAKLGKT